MVQPKPPAADSIGNYIWLFPLTYILHLIEEYFAGAGFTEWLAQIAGGQLSTEKFLLLNALGWVLMALGIWLVSLNQWRWLLIAIAGTVMLNALSHLLASLLTQTYSPGLWTGLVLWIPLGVYTIANEYGVATQRSLITGILLAFLLSVVIILLAISNKIARS